MPLQIIFHLELARSSTITTTWNSVEDRFQVTGISGGHRLVGELRKHADEAGIHPDQLKTPYTGGVNSEDTAWLLLARYTDFDDFHPLVQSAVNEAFAKIFDHLRIEESSTVGDHRTWGDLKIFMMKPDGEFTPAWVWKDNIVWIQTRH